MMNDLLKVAEEIGFNKGYKNAQMDSQFEISKLTEQNKEMLEALKEIIKDHFSLYGNIPTTTKLIRKAEAIIQKIEGE